MGCHGSSGIIEPIETANLDHEIVHLVVTGQTEQLINTVQAYDYELDVNAPLNFRGDTLLHYACARNNVELVKYLL